MKIKKILASVLLAAVVLTSAGCSPGSDNNGTSGGNETSGSETSGGTASGETPSETLGETSGNTEAAPSGPKAEAKDFDFVVMQFNCREFEIKGGNSEVFLGDNISGEKKGVMTLNDNGAADAFVQAFQQPLPDDPNFPNRFIIDENGDFWSAVDHIEAKFYLDAVNCEPLPEEFPWIGTYFLLGKSSNYKFDFTEENTINSLPDGFGFGPDYVMSVNWDIKGILAANGGNTDVGDPNVEGSGGGGIHRLGMKMRNEGLDVYTLSVNWTDVTVYVSDKAKFDEYVAKVSEITGAVMSADAKVVEVG